MGLIETNSSLTKLIKNLIIEQQDKSILKGLLVAEIKLGLWQKYGIEIHSNKIHLLIKHNISGVKTTTMPTTGMPINIYRIER